MDEAGNNDTAINNTSQASAQQHVEITAGELLKAMRERAGVELETIATALKVSTQKLQALEANDFTVMPAACFTRGLAASVCRHLGQDPAPVLEKIPDDKPASHTTTEANTSPKHVETVISTGVRRKFTARSMLVIAGIVLLLVAVAIFTVPSLTSRFNNIGREKAEPASTPSVSTQSIPAEPETAASTPAQAAASQPLAAASTPQSGASENVLQITATGNTWAKVSSSSGKTLYRRNLVAGQTHNVPITKYPVYVEVGKTENTQITDRGTPLNLSSLASQGHARFELTP